MEVSMQRVLFMVFCSALLAVVSVAEEAPENTVPKTFEGSGDAFREGGKELGEGFRGVGRGIKKTFKGEAAKEEYKKGAKIGEGFKDIGLGTAGGGRAVGRSVKKGVDANEAQGEGPDPEDAERPLDDRKTLNEEPLP
jgi:hypothetical protein